MPRIAARGTSQRSWKRSSRPVAIAESSACTECEQRKKAVIASERNDGFSYEQAGEARIRDAN